MENETIGQKIKSLRKSERLTQIQLAEIIHCGLSVISDWERDIKIPSVESIIKICRCFDVSADYLLGLKEI